MRCSFRVPPPGDPENLGDGKKEKAHRERLAEAAATKQLKVKSGYSHEEHRRAPERLVRT